MKSKNLDDGNNNFFYQKVWLFGGGAETSLNQFEHEMSKITLHKAIFFVKWFLLIQVHVKALEAVEAGKKIAVFQIHVNYFLFWQNLFF